MMIHDYFDVVFRAFGFFCSFRGCALWKWWWSNRNFRCYPACVLAFVEVARGGLIFVRVINVLLLLETLGL